MKNLAKVHVGVDVSKYKLDVYILEKRKHFVVSNDECGLNQLLVKLSKHCVGQVVCESSGGYENGMLELLAKNNIVTWQVEPKTIKTFIVFEGMKAKTDAIDAYMIALFAASKNRPYAPLCTKLLGSKKELNVLSKRRSQLKKIMIAEKARLQNNPDDPCKLMIREHVDFLSKQIINLQKTMQHIIAQDKKLYHKSKVIQSMPGMGPIAAFTLIAEVPELGDLNEK